MKITVRLKDIYGKQTVYPVCEAAQLFCRIANTKTLTREILDSVKALGYSVVVEQQSITV
jgi:hypothetical protein